MAPAGRRGQRAASDVDMTLATESFSGGREKGEWDRREWAPESIE